MSLLITKQYMATKREEKLKFANHELRDLVVKYFVSTGLLTTAINASIAALGSLQTGILDVKQFVVVELFILIFMILNGAKFWSEQYNKGKE
jgi:hypothetical protein